MRLLPTDLPTTTQFLARWAERWGCGTIRFPPSFYVLDNE